MENRIEMRMDPFIEKVLQQEQRQARRDAMRRMKEQVVSGIFWFSTMAFAFVALWQAPVWSAALRNLMHAIRLGA